MEKPAKSTGPCPAPKARGTCSLAGGKRHSKELISGQDLRLSKATDSMQSQRLSNGLQQRVGTRDRARSGQHFFATLSITPLVDSLSLGANPTGRDVGGKGRGEGSKVPLRSWAARTVGRQLSQD